MKKCQLFFKRFTDIFVSIIAFIILFPGFIAISIAIKSTSKGPVFFLQKRIGLKGNVFSIIKFRTMIVNAEFIGEGLRVSSESDNRITSVGRFLRATSLDELPQLINVIIGNMSIVGPRPPVTYHPYKGVENYPEWAKKRFDMRPGITGLAQATVRNSASWDERIVIDNQYVDSFTLGLDIKILFLTIKRVFSSNDIYASSNNQTDVKLPANKK